MKELLHHGRHLVRAAALFAAGFLVFLVVRGLLVPEGFGALGHYRAGAIDDNRSMPLVHAGQAACEECHGDVVAARAGSKHTRVRCEACHGPLAAHAADPSASKPTRPNVDQICSVCHLANTAKPATFPQVEPESHAGGSGCGTCHSPHHPEVS